MQRTLGAQYKPETSAPLTQYFKRRITSKEGTTTLRNRIHCAARFKPRAGQAHAASSSILLLKNYMDPRTQPCSVPRTLQVHGGRESQDVPRTGHWGGTVCNQNAEPIIY